MGSLDKTIEKIRYDMDAMKTASNIVLESWDDSVSRSLDNNVIGEIQRASSSFLEEVEYLTRSMTEKKENIDYSQRNIDKDYEAMLSLLSQIEEYVQSANKKETTYYDRERHVVGYARRKGNGITEYSDREHHITGFAENNGDTTTFTDREHHTQGYARRNENGTTEFTDREHHTQGYARRKGDDTTEHTDREHHTQGYARRYDDGSTEYTDREHHSTGYSK